MKYQALFSLKNNETYSRLSPAAVVIGASRIKVFFTQAERKTDHEQLEHRLCRSFEI